MRGLVAALVLAGAVASPYRPSFDHQTQTYTVSHKPVSVDGSINLELFFSPDHSIDTITNLIQQAPDGSRIDIGTPSMDSWVGCTYGDSGCQGCNVTGMRAETFPVFPAILNAAHQRSVSFRIISNNYNTPTCEGQIAPFDWLALQSNIEVRYFASVTFLHEKYVQVVPPAGTPGVNGSASGRKGAVSSVNWSRTSFTKNREAGVVLVGKGGGEEELLDALTAVFEDDWSRTTPYTVNNTYSPSEMSVITSPAALPVTIPSPPSIPGEFVTPVPTVFSTSASSTSGVFVSPDYSMDTLLADLNTTQYSLEIHIYQVTDDTLCDKIEELFNNGVNVTLLASSAIYSYYDKNGARYCYKRLYDAGMSIRLTPSFFTYSHQKYWIIDGKKLGLSTGNWSPTDFNWPMPGQSGTYPAFPDPDWQDANRDLQFFTTDAGVIQRFRQVLNNDYEQGTDYTTSW